MPAELATVDLDGVSIVDAEVEFRGIGSPPDGEMFSRQQLEEMAQASQELEAAGEWRVPNKITGEIRGRGKLGHSTAQTLLSSSVADGELPAAGWITNQRVSEDGTRLLADIKKVPQTVAKLIQAGAYRTRSAELSRIKSQKTGKTHDWVVSGVAWLGGKMPAIRTLDDVVRLYEGDDGERRFLQVDELEIADADALRDLVAELGTTVAGLERSRADTRSRMPDEKFTDEQRRKFADATGLEAEKVTDDMLAKAGVVEETTEPAIDDDTAKQLADALGVEGDTIDPKKLLEAAKARKPEQVRLEDEALRRLEEKTKDADDRSRKLEDQLRLERRDSFIANDAIKAGKIEPGEREYIELMYDANETKAREYVKNLSVRDELLLEFGSDEHDDDLTPEKRRELEDAEYEADATRRFGMAKETVL